MFLEPYGGMFENHNTKAVSVALYSPGGGWGSERQVVRSNYWEIRAPRVAVDALGGVVVVWVSDTWLGDRLWWSRLAPAEQP